MMRLLAVLAIVAALIFIEGGMALAQAQSIQDLAERAVANAPGIIAKEHGVMLVGTNQYGNAVGMLPPLPSVNLPAMPMDGVRPPRPAAPQAPLAAQRPPAPPAPVPPPAPKPPVETAGKAAPPKDYPRGEVIGNQAKRLYLAGQPVGEIRAKRIRLKGELVDVNQVKLDIHIWPGNYLSKIAIPVDRGQYQVAFSTGKGWVISPEKTSKIPAGYKPVQIGD